jgi:hypothetical protein
MWLSSASVGSWPSRCCARDLADRLVHRLVVVGRRHDQVAHRHQIVVVDLVVVDERAARRLDDADALARRGARRGQLVAEQRGSSSSPPITSAACKSSIIRAQWNASGAC